MLFTFLIQSKKNVKKMVTEVIPEAKVQLQSVPKIQKLLLSPLETFQHPCLVVKPKVKSKQKPHWLVPYIQLINGGVEGFNQSATLALKGFIAKDDASIVEFNKVKHRAENTSISDLKEITKNLMQAKNSSQAQAIYDLMQIIPLLLAEIQEILGRIDDNSEDALCKAYCDYLQVIEQQIQQAQTQLASVIYAYIFTYIEKENRWPLTSEDFVNLYQYVEKHGAMETKSATAQLPFYHGIIPVKKVETEQGVYFLPQSFTMVIEKPPFPAWLFPDKTARYQLQRKAMMTVAQINTAASHIQRHLQTSLRYSLIGADTFFSDIEKLQQDLAKEITYNQTKKVTNWKKIFYKGLNQQIDQWTTDLRRQQIQCLVKKISLLENFTQQIEDEIASNKFPQAQAIQELRRRFLKLKKEVEDTSLADDFQNIFSNFEKVTDFRYIYIEKLKRKGLFVKYMLQQHHRTFYMPNDLYVKQFFNFAFPYLQAEDASALQTIEKFILGQEFYTVEQLKSHIKPLFLGHKDPENTLHDFIAHLVEEYIKPQLTGADSAAYQFLNQYYPTYIQAYNKKEADRAEFAVKVCKRILEARPEIAFDGTQAIAIGNESFPVTKESVCQQLQLLHYVLPVNQHFRDSLYNLTGQYVERFLKQSAKNTHYADFISAIGHEGSIIHYGMALFQSRLGSPEQLLDQPFLLEHQALLQLGMDELLIAHFTEAKQQQLPSKIHDVVEKFASRAVKQQYRLAWLKAILFETGFANNKAHTLDTYTVDNLVIFYGQSNMPALIEAFREFLKAPYRIDHPIAYDIIKRYFTEDFIQRYNCVDLYQQLQQHLIKIDQYHKEQEFIQSFIASFEKGQWNDVKTLLQSLTDNLSIYPQGSDEYQRTQATLNHLYPYLEKQLKALQAKAYYKTLMSIEQEVVTYWPNQTERQQLENYCKVTAKEIATFKNQEMKEKIKGYLDLFYSQYKPYPAKESGAIVIDEIMAIYNFYQQCADEAQTAFYLRQIEHVYTQVANDVFLRLKKISLNDVDTHSDYLMQAARWIRLMNNPSHIAQLKHYCDKLFLRYMDYAKDAIGRYSDKLPDGVSNILGNFEEVLEQAGYPYATQVFAALKAKDNQTFNHYYDQYKEIVTSERITKGFTKKLRAFDEQLFNTIRKVYSYSEADIKRLQLIRDRMIQERIDEVTNLPLTQEESDLLRLETGGFKENLGYIVGCNRVRTIEKSLNVLVKSYLTSIDIERLLPTSTSKLHAATVLNTSLKETAAIMTKSSIRTLLYGPQQEGFFASIRQKEEDRKPKPKVIQRKSLLNLSF